jgi:RimJ/RimL family protein N-acetyltransferase
VIVRALEWRDFDDLVASYYLLYDERAAGVPIGTHLYAARPGPADEVRWFSSLWQDALSGDAIVSVAEIDGHVRGNCTLHRIGGRPDSEDGDVGELGILVHRDFRGQGLGTALLAHALRRARGAFRIVRLSVFSTNPRAASLYARMGFRPAGRIPRAFRRGTELIDEEIMVLELDRPQGPEAWPWLAPGGGDST